MGERKKPEGPEAPGAPEKWKVSDYRQNLVGLSLSFLARVFHLLLLFQLKG